MTHTQHENFPWTIAIVDHAPRTETRQYVASRTLMHKIVDQLPDWVLRPVDNHEGHHGGDDYEDHHGGSIWVKDEKGWLFVQQALGIEWSAQFCADPIKIDQLRLTAKRIVAAFPETLPAYQALGYRNAPELLETQIQTAEHISHWTDSIFNASMPIPRAAHTGTYPAGAGYHHYPKPIVDIVHFCRPNFKVFVADGKFPAVVVPMSGDPNDHRVRLVAAHPSAPHAHRLLEEQKIRRRRGRDIAPAGQRGGAYPPAPGQPIITDEESEGPTVLPADDDLARQAFRVRGVA